MSNLRYPAYTDTKLDWLPQYPSHWTAKPFWSLFRRIKRVGCPDETLLSIYRDHGVVEKSSRTDNHNNVSDDLSAYQLVEPGNLAINKMKAWQGSVAVSKLRGIVSPAYFVYDHQHDENNDYLNYLFRSNPFIHAYLILSKGVRPFQWDLDPQQHSRLPIMLPPAREQAAIVTFLDRETRKIDALVGEQERLIALLKEKRQAVISQAVTKGLDPTVPMKHSGVEWLGEVPAHWLVTALKRVSKIGNGSTPNRERPEFWSADGFPWLNSSHVNRDEITHANEFVTDKALQECHLPVISPPAVLVGITGQGRTRGMASLLTFKATINQHVASVCSDQSKLQSGFLRRQIENMYSVLRFESDGGGATKGAITCEQIGLQVISVPPIQEQTAIMNYIDKELAAIGVLSAECDRAIALLRERRAALIAAAVTGKIDAREHFDVLSAQAA